MELEKERYLKAKNIPFDHLIEGSSKILQNSHLLLQIGHSLSTIMDELLKLSTDIIKPKDL